MQLLPLVSIITPCYNSRNYIESTIKSVLAQTYKNWEMIIVEDASVDGSLESITSYAKEDERIRIIKNANNIGTAQSRNKAIREAQGTYIAFLDNDDIWFSDKLEKQITLMEEKKILLSYSAYETIDKEGRTIGYFSVPNKVTYEDMLKTSIIGTLTMIYNADIIGKFYFENRGHEDYSMKLDILKEIPYAQGINETLAKYRILNNSLSRNKLRAAKWQWYIYRKVEKLSLYKSIYYFIHYTYRGITKYKSV